MSVFQEFKTFALKGNLVDLAIGVVLGAAFGKIITAFTEALISPLIGMLIRESTLNDLSFSIGSTLFPIGLFLQAMVDFVIIAWILFLFVRGVNAATRKKEIEVGNEPPPPSVTERLLTEIRDSLQHKN